MLQVAAPFPHVGSDAYFDTTDLAGRPVTEKVRIIAAKGADQVLIAIRSRRYPREIASGNRTVPLDALREHEQPASSPKPSGRTKAARSTGAQRKGSRR